MVDTLTVEERSERMGRIRAKDTKPELIVRDIVRRLGYRYRKHRRDIPGTPDLAFIGRRKAIFVHGCFWHGHRCKLGRMPKSRMEFWSAKIGNNKKRDAYVKGELRRQNWNTLIVWECELGDRDGLSEKLRSFLNA